MAQAKRQFLVDEKGRKRSVVMPIAEYRRLMEDLEDLALIAERKDEPGSPLQEVKRRLEKKWRSYQVEVRRSAERELERLQPEHAE